MASPDPTTADEQLLSPRGRGDDEGPEDGDAEPGADDRSTGDKDAIANEQDDKVENLAFRHHNDAFTSQDEPLGPSRVETPPSPPPQTPPRSHQPAVKTNFASEEEIVAPERLLYTLAIIKPHIVRHPDTCAAILRAIESEGFMILESKRVQLCEEDVITLYQHHRTAAHFAQLVQSLTDGPLVAMVLAKSGAVHSWRAFIGDADPAQAAPGTLRAMYGKSRVHNAVHGSSSAAAAEREIRFLFPNRVLALIPTGNESLQFFDQNINKVLIRGLSELCRLKPAEPVTWLGQWLVDNNPNKPIIEEPTEVA